MNRFCKACNIKKDKNSYLRERTVCKNCYNRKDQKSNNNNTLIPNQETKIENNKNNDHDPSFSA